MRLLLAIKIFFRTLLDAAAAESVVGLLAGEPSAPQPQPKAVEEQPPPKKASPDTGRSEALTLLAALQREARFLDIINEPLDQYSDAQIGAAARDVLRDCNATLKRMFSFEAVSQQAEGDEIDLPVGFDAARFRLTGNVAGEPPFKGSLAHHGWQATKCELPRWSGNREAAFVVAPAEVELS